MEDNYKSIRANSYGEYREKGSKFLAYLFPMSSEQEFESSMIKVKSEHPKARHYCYAYKIGLSDDKYRVNDDGEPSGTAGKPIFGQFLSNQLSDIFCVVVRYFGGTKLGATGLIRAYKSATADAIDSAEIITKYIYKEYQLNCSFEKMGVVLNQLKELDFDILSQHFETDVKIDVRIRQSKANDSIKMLKAKLLGWSKKDILDDTEIDYCSIIEIV